MRYARNPLEGMLTQRTFYGPPGFGETPAKDAREKVYLLKLGRLVTMTPIRRSEGENVR